MSLDADSKQLNRTPLQARGRSSARALQAGCVLLAGGALLTGCALGSVRPLQRVSVGNVDRSTCEGLYVQSIWKGEDLGGPQCQSYVALEGSAEIYDQRRVQKVCEQTQIRTILSGEASSNFTAQACASHEPRYQQARLGRACRDISRARTRRQEELTPAQSAVCKTYLGAPSKGEARLASAGAVRTPRWGNGFASVPERSVATKVTAAIAAERVASVESATEASAAAAATAPIQSTAAAEPVQSAGVPGRSVNGSPVNGSPVNGSPVNGSPVNGSPVNGSPINGSPINGSPINGSPAAEAPGEVARTERAICEDRLIESIWKGADVTGGAECAPYASQYRLSRIQSVCEGAQIRSDRSGEALPRFTLQACQAALAPAPSAAAPPAVTEAAAPGSDPPGSDPPGDPPPVPPPPGLDEKTIASAVDANWRSIGRDCSAVAPRSRSMEPLNVAVTVTINVAAAGQVRDVSVRARGYRELEACIEGSVRGWVFPAAERDTEIGLPLVFAGQ